jgi:hypothetical protein
VGYGGVLCTVCAPSFFQEGDVSVAMSCQPCPPSSAWLLALTALFLVLLAVLLLKLNSSKLFQALLVSLSVGTTYWQLLSFLGAVQLQWSNGASHF